jgi:putative sterol carrier protein
LSHEWIEALDRAAHEGTGPPATEADDVLVLQQVVIGAPSGDARYHLTLTDGQIRVAEGDSKAPTVTITVPYETAAAINAGRESAQAAFMTGRLRVGGDVSALLRHREALAAVDDVFAGVRRVTTY